MTKIPNQNALSEPGSRVMHLVRRYLHPRGYPPIVRAVREEKLTYLGEDALLDLYRQVRRIEEGGVEGVLIEAGCALGGSAIVLARAKSAQRPLYVYDVFGMIPPPTADDEADVHRRYEEIRSGKSKGIGGDTYYGYIPDLLETVRRNFESHGFRLEEEKVHLVRGLFQDTLHVDGAVALAHIDGDWYESVMTCLQRIEPHLSSGGVLIIDDYYCWSGARKAVDVYFSGRDGFDFHRKARLHIVRR